MQQSQSLPALATHGTVSTTNGTRLPAQLKDSNSFSRSLSKSKSASAVALPWLPASSSRRTPPMEIGHAGMRRTQQFMWSHSVNLLEESVCKLPFLRPPLAETHTYELDEEEMKERAEKLHRKMVALGKMVKPKPKKSKLAQMLEEPDDNTSDKKQRSEMNVLAMDRKRVEAQVAAMQEPVQVEEEKETRVRDRVWGAIFAPMPSPRRLLPPSFLGEFPCSPASSSSSPPRRRGVVGGTEAKDLPFLEIEELFEITKVCAMFQGLVATKNAEGQYVGVPPLISRSSFCRLLCALNGLSAHAGDPTQFVRAVAVFDSMADLIPNRWGQHLGCGNLSAIWLDVDGGRAETPVCLLFSKLIHDMAMDLGPKPEYGARLEKTRERFFGVLLPEAAQYAEERASRLRGRKQGERPHDNADMVSHGSNKGTLSVRTIKRKQLEPDLMGKTASSSVSRGAPPHHHGLRKEKTKAKAQIAQTEEEEVEADPSPKTNPLYGNAFAVLKGEVLATQLLEPEILHFVAEFSVLFRPLFCAYSDVTAGPARCGGERSHMTLRALIRFCHDFNFFPTRVDLQTIEWLYRSGEGWETLSWEEEEEAKRVAAASQAAKCKRKKGVMKVTATSAMAGSNMSHDGSRKGLSTSTTSAMKKKEAADQRFAQIKERWNEPVKGTLDYGDPSESMRSTKKIERKSSGSPPSSPSAPPSPSPSSPSRRGGGTGSRSPMGRNGNGQRSGRGTATKGVGDPHKYIEWHGKWLREHLAWITKDLESFSTIEYRSLLLLWAIDEMLNDKNMDVRELFLFFDQDGRGLVSLKEFQVVVTWMRLRDSPTVDDVGDLFTLLAAPLTPACTAQQTEAPSPRPAPLSARKALASTTTSLNSEWATPQGLTGPPDLEISVLKQALGGLRKKKELMGLATTNPFVKDYHKMCKAEVDAMNYCESLWELLDERKLTPEEFCQQRLKFDKNDKMSSKELHRSTLYLVRLLGRPTKALTIDRPFELLANSEGMVCRQEFLRVVGQVKEATGLREAGGDAKMGLYSTYVPETDPPVLNVAHPSAGNRKNMIFGHQAFIECLLKIALLHLSYHAAAIQADQPVFCKAVWLLMYLRWQFDAAKQRTRDAAEVLRSGPRSLEGEAPPRYITPLRRLLQEHPDLFDRVHCRQPPDLCELSDLAQPPQIAPIAHPRRPAPPSLSSKNARPRAHSNQTDHSQPPSPKSPSGSSSSSCALSSRAQITSCAVSSLAAAAVASPNHQQQQQMPRTPSTVTTRQKPKEKAPCKPCAQKQQASGWGYPYCQECSYADTLLQGCLGACPPAPRSVGPPGTAGSTCGAQTVLEAAASTADKGHQAAASESDNAGVPRFLDKTLFWLASNC